MWKFFDLTRSTRSLNHSRGQKKKKKNHKNFQICQFPNCFCFYFYFFLVKVFFCFESFLNLPPLSDQEMGNWCRYKTFRNFISSEKSFWKFPSRGVWSSTNLIYPVFSFNSAEIINWLPIKNSTWELIRCRRVFKH